MSNTLGRVHSLFYTFLIIAGFFLLSACSGKNKSAESTTKAPISDHIYFTVIKSPQTLGSQLWKTDATPENTTLLTNKLARAQGSHPDGFSEDTH